jgi:hypothetical protein
MRKRSLTKTVLKIAAGAVVVATGVALRGMLPELYRYVRLKRM